MSFGSEGKKLLNTVKVHKCAVRSIKLKVSTVINCYLTGAAIPSLRARDCSNKEKEALNYLFLLIPLLNVTIPFFWKSFAVVWSADTVAFFLMYAWKVLSLCHILTHLLVTSLSPLIWVWSVVFQSSSKLITVSMSGIY